MTKTLQSLSALLLIVQMVLAPCLHAQTMTCEDLPSLTESYLDYRKNGDLIRSTQYLIRIRNHIKEIAEKNSLSQNYNEYVSALSYLDAQAIQNENRTAIYDVALALQSSWEITYGRQLDEIQLKRRNTAIKTGAIAGGAGGLIAGTLLATLLGTSTLLRPQAAPQYFRVLRHLLPLMGLTGALGAVSGVEIGHFLNHSGQLDKNIPPAPAQILRLGIVNDDFGESDDGFVEEILAASASIAIGSIPYVITMVRTLKAANVAATPAKVHPLVLAGSIAASVIVDKGVLWAADRRQFRILKNQLLGSVNQLNQSVEDNNESAIIASSDLLIQHSLQVAAFLNRPLLEAQSKFLEEQEEAQKKFGPAGKSNPKQYNTQLQEATNDLREAISEALSEGTYRFDWDSEGYLVRGILRNGTPADLSDLNASSQNRAALYVQKFDEWAPGGHPFEEYLARVDQQRDAALANELKAGQIGNNASHVLVQAAAALRQTGNEYAASILAVRLLATLERMENFIIQNLDAASPEGAFR